MKPKQSCHGAKRGLQSRALLGSLVLATASLNACGDDQGVESAELQAILHDGDLTQIMSSTLLASPPAPGTGTAGTSGDVSGAGGATGAAGRGAPGTGVAGSIGTAGTGIGGRGTAGVAGTGFAGSFGRDRHGRHGRPAASLGRPRASGASTTAT